jgi:hypothetical protein
MLARAFIASLLFVVAAPLAAQSGVIRGVITDSAGRPIRGVEVLALKTDRAGRTDAQGLYTITRVPWGQTVVMARLLGYRPAEQAVTVGDSGEATLNLTLGTAIQIIDTVRITSHDHCQPYRFDGFDCRRDAGIGQFRGPEELRALRSVYWADMFEGFAGLRRVPFQNENLDRDWTISPTTGWRCLKIGFNGREPTARETIVRPEDIYAIEHYDVYEKVPEAYKRLAWPGDQREPCSLIMYWTRVFIEENRRP